MDSQFLEKNLLRQTCASPRRRLHREMDKTPPLASETSSSPDSMPPENEDGKCQDKWKTSKEQAMERFEHLDQEQWKKQRKQPNHSFQWAATLVSVFYHFTEKIWFKDKLHPVMFPPHWTRPIHSQIRSYTLESETHVQLGPFQESVVLHQTDKHWQELCKFLSVLCILSLFLSPIKPSPPHKLASYWSQFRLLPIAAGSS